MANYEALKKWREQDNKSRQVFYKKNNLVMNERDSKALGQIWKQHGSIDDDNVNNKRLEELIHDIDLISSVVSGSDLEAFNDIDLKGKIRKHLRDYDDPTCPTGKMVKTVILNQLIEKLKEKQKK